MTTTKFATISTSALLNDHLVVGIVITTVFKVPIIPLCKSTTRSNEFIGQEDTVEHSSSDSIERKRRTINNI